MDERWEWYNESINQCQKMIEHSKDTFRVGLLESADVFKQDAANLLNSFVVNKIFIIFISIIQTIIC